MSGRPGSFRSTLRVPRVYPPMRRDVPAQASREERSGYRVSYQNEPIRTGVSNPSRTTRARARSDARLSPIASRRS